MRRHRSFPISSPIKIKDALLELSKDYNKVVWLDSNDHKDKYGNFDAILAFDRQTDKSDFSFKNIDELSNYIDNKHDWLFGYFSYDLKNEFEELTSNNFDGLHFPNVHFFQPQKIVTLKNRVLTFHYLDELSDEIEKDYAQVEESANQNHSEKKYGTLGTHQIAYP